MAVFRFAGIAAIASAPTLLADPARGAEAADAFDIPRLGGVTVDGDDADRGEAGFAVRILHFGDGKLPGAAIT